MNHKNIKSSPKKIITIEERNQLSFRGSAINGSSLLNIYDDIRSYVEKGSTIYINNISYKTSTTGEWSSNCIELSTDYHEDTSFDCIITIPSDANLPAYNLSRKKKEILPISSASISQAVEQLNTITRFLIYFLILCLIFDINSVII
jgi:hypothetical protein